jgi:Flp pilus assembly protein TadD
MTVRMQSAQKSPLAGAGATTAHSMAQSALRQAAHFKDNGQRDETEAWLLRAAALAPDNWRTLSTLGHLRFERRHFAAAVAPLGAAVDLAPDGIEPRKLYANALHMAYRSDEADEQLRELARRHPDDAECVHNLGLYFNRSGRLPDAEACFRRAMRLKPDWPAPYRALGHVFLRAGRPDKASDYLRRAYRMKHNEMPDSTSPIVRDASLAEGIEKDGLAITSVAMPFGGETAKLVRLPRVVVERSSAVPVTPSGRFFSSTLDWRIYPERFDFLWSAATQRAIADKLTQPDDFTYGLVVSGHGGNYGHWLLDALPVLLALKVFPSDQVPALIVDGLPPYRADSMAAFLARHRLPDVPIAVTDQPYFSVRDAFVVSGISRAIQVAAIAALRPDVEPRRRLFVGRRDASHRKLVNEDAVFAALEPLGFERADPNRHAFAAQVNMFAEASIVVGVQGAALANCMFCAPGTPLVIVYPDRVMPYYEDLAVHVPLRMVPVAGTIRDNRPGILPDHCDFAASPDAVRAAALQALG